MADNEKRKNKKDFSTGEFKIKCEWMQPSKTEAFELIEDAEGDLCIVEKISIEKEIKSIGTVSVQKELLKDFLNIEEKIPKGFRGKLFKVNYDLDQVFDENKQCCKNEIIRSIKAFVNKHGLLGLGDNQNGLVMRDTFKSKEWSTYTNQFMEMQMLTLQELSKPEYAKWVTRPKYEKINEHPFLNIRRMEKLKHFLDALEMIWRYNNTWAKYKGEEHAVDYKFYSEYGDFVLPYPEDSQKYDKSIPERMVTRQEYFNSLGFSAYNLRKYAFQYRIGMDYYVHEHTLKAHAAVQFECLTLLSSLFLINLRNLTQEHPQVNTCVDCGITRIARTTLKKYRCPDCASMGKKKVYNESIEKKAIKMMKFGIDIDDIRNYFEKKSEYDIRYLTKKRLKKIYAENIENAANDSVGLAFKKVSLMNYDAVWKTAFVAEEKKIMELLGRYKPDVQHIGSTSIPGMLAKPIIDIMVGVNDNSQLEVVAKMLEEIGYDNFGECGRPGRYFLVKGDPENCTHHLHLVVKESKYWTDNLLFRDFMKNNPLAADEYKKIKQELAHQYPDDRTMYRIKKSEYVEDVIQRLIDKR